jgi:hypothetical protein
MVLLLAGCFQDSLTIVDQLPAEGVTDLFADSDRGDLAYVGDGEGGTFDIAVTQWGTGITRHEAKVARKMNEWGAVVDGALLDMWGRSPPSNAGVSFGVRGRSRMNVESVMVDGDVELVNVEGFHYVTANGVFGYGIAGDVDFYATRNGIDVELDPGPDSRVLIQSWGDARLDLPFGLDYDLEVYADPAWGVNVTDLGFDNLYVAADYVRASRGEGRIRVEVWVAEGKFILREKLPR